MKKTFTYAMDMNRINDAARAFARECGANVCTDKDLRYHAAAAREASAKALGAYMAQWDEKGSTLSVTLPEFPSGWWWLRTELEIITATSLLWQCGGAAAERARRVMEATGALIGEAEANPKA